MTDLEYWKECIADAAEECDLEMTDKQLDLLAGEISNGHENYGMAFYQPPASDRIAVIKREADARLVRMEREFEAYQDNANAAIKMALRVHPSDCVTIGEYGEVMLHAGRSHRIQ